MASGFLQAKNVGEIIKGGYTLGCPPGYQHVPTSGLSPLPDNCEWTDLEGDARYKDWATVQDDTEEHSADTTYYYSDSVSASNRLSSRVKVRVRTTWKVLEYTDTNDIILQVKGYLLGVERYFINPGTRPGTFDIRVSGYWSDGVNTISRGNYVPSRSGWATNAAQLWTAPISDPLLLSNFTVKLAPSKTTAEWPTVLYENAYNGDWANHTGVSLDTLAIGMMFRNNLPADLPQPELPQVDETVDLCTSTVTDTLTFPPIGVNGSVLRVWWRYEGQDWSDNRSAQETVVRNTETRIVVADLLAETKVYWRAQYVPLPGNGLHASEVLEWDSITRWVPAVDMTIPDITDPECASIKKGGLIDQFTTPTCYNDNACVEAKLPANYCDTMEQEMKDYEDPGCEDEK